MCLEVFRRWRYVPVCLMIVGALAACGSTHLSSTATEPTFPNTPAGVQARWVVQTNHGQPMADAVLRTHFNHFILAHNTPAQMNETFALFGQLRLVSITSSQPRTLMFVVSVRGGQRFLMRLSVDPDGLISKLDNLREIAPPGSPASTIPPLAAGWVAQPVTFQAGGVTIYGTYTHPRTAAARSIPAAVLLAGAGTATDRNENGTATTNSGVHVVQRNRNTLEAVANWLSADGVASLRYDKLGSGQTGWSRYAGHTEQVGLKTYEQEAVAALSFVSKQPQVDPSRLAAVGHSQGGVYALLLATGVAVSAPKIHAVVLLEPLPVRMLSGIVSAPGTVPKSVRQAQQRAVASLRRTGRLPRGLPAVVAQSLNPTDWGTPLEISQIDRYNPAALAAKLAPNTPVLLTCSNADEYFTCALEDRVATGASNADAKLDYVHLQGVSHILKEDIAFDTATWDQALPFSTQLRSALHTFVANNL